MAEKNETKVGIVKCIPNMITMVRVFLAPFIFLAPVLSIPFFVIYSICGVSDALDGFTARALHCASEKGSLLDSIADIIFYFILTIRLIPYLYARVASFIWYMLAVVILIRLCAYFTAFIKYKRFASLHTYGNKLTGAAVFSMPFALLVFDEFTVCFAVLTVASISSVEELVVYIKSKTYPQSFKSVFFNEK